MKWGLLILLCELVGREDMWSPNTVLGFTVCPTTCQSHLELIRRN